MFISFTSFVVMFVENVKSSYDKCHTGIFLCSRGVCESDVAAHDRFVSAL